MARTVETARRSTRDHLPAENPVAYDDVVPQTDSKQDEFPKTAETADPSDPEPSTCDLPTHPAGVGPLEARNEDWADRLRGKINPWESIYYDEGRDIKTLKELTILNILNAIMKKPDWVKKCKDPVIVQKWKSECSSVDTEDALIEYAIAECQFYADLARDVCRHAPVEGVFEADYSCDLELKKNLIDGLSKLMSESDEQDWHPGSDNQVLDIIHPSLFPLVFGRSRILKASDVHSIDALDVILMLTHCNSAIVASPKVKSDKHREDGHSSSKQFQWIPSEISVFKERAEFSSYINNLHPESHKALYDTIEKIFFCFVPLFNATLTAACHGPICRWAPNMCEDAIYPDRPGSDDPEDVHEAWWDNRIPLVPPFTDQFNRENRLWKADSSIDLSPTEGHDHRKLQVIVKVASIHLTPDKPCYAGGAWHVEGMLNESIVSTGLYYYDEENITTSQLGFRIGVSDPEYEQGDDPAVLAIYGFVNEQASNQYLGSVNTKQDRMIAFPNYMQHQVQPFELENKQKPGHRKILAFFLVDPTKNIISTQNVIPQNQAWWPCTSFGKGMTNTSKSAVADFMGFPYSLAQAKNIRTELMEERGAFMKASDENTFTREFSLCEH
eukprot:GHVH01002831.1.p1 GENE.GHVH01002831.1~~GHVH01002831.1.p1  ORF type:complete len:614 (+),score=92.48 GHVH01002831.1:106-1947(+)